MLTKLAKCEIILLQIGEKIKLKLKRAFLTGISDFYFNNSKKDRRSIPPLWMDTEEKAHWKRGLAYAKEMVWVR